MDNILHPTLLPSSTAPPTLSAQLRYLRHAHPELDLDVDLLREVMQDDETSCSTEAAEHLLQGECLLSIVVACTQVLVYVSGPCLDAVHVATISPQVRASAGCVPVALRGLVYRHAH